MLAIKGSSLQHVQLRSTAVSDSIINEVMAFYSFICPLCHQTQWIIWCERMGAFPVPWHRYSHDILFQLKCIVKKCLTGHFTDSQTYFWHDMTLVPWCLIFFFSVFWPIWPVVSPSTVKNPQHIHVWNCFKLLLSDSDPSTHLLV